MDLCIQLRQWQSYWACPFTRYGYYDDRGLIPGTKRNAANQRLFDDMEVEWLFLSLTLKNTGLSLKDGKHYIELYQKGDSNITGTVQAAKGAKIKDSSGNGEFETPSGSTQPKN